MTTWIRDLRHGARLLWRQPSFTLAAIAVLALGIGANTAIFSLVNAFLLKPLALEKPEEIVGVYSRDAAKPDSYRAFSYAEYAELREREGVFRQLMAHNVAMVGLASGDATADDASTTRRAFVDIVSSNYFPTLGARLFRGREFTPEEERPGANQAVAIVSHNYWKRSGSDPEMVGKSVRVNGRAFTVVGIAAPGFSGTTALISSELYLPLGMYETLENDFDDRGRPLADPVNRVLIVVGRLLPGLELADADRRLGAMAASLSMAAGNQSAGTDRRDLVVRPLSRLSISTAPSSDTRLAVPAFLLLAMAGAVLLVASLNVANMMLARGSTRRREISIRLALGAGRRSVLRQLVTESLLLALIGGAAGLAVAFWGTTVLVRSLALLAPIDLVYNAAPDPRVLAATLVFCVFSTLLFGLGPALQLSKPDVFTHLKGREQEGAVGGRPGWRGLFARRNLLVVGQLALSLMLLSAAGLFLRSSIRTADIEPGFRVERGVVIEVDPSLAGYDNLRGAQIYRDLIPRLRALPGVEAASLAATVPFGMVSLGKDLEPVGGEGAPRPATPGSSAEPEALSSSFNLVGPGYFETLGIPLLKGREFEDRDAVPHAAVAILDQSAAAALWPKGEALGQRLRLVSDDAGAGVQEVEIVGVVATVQLRIGGGDRRQPQVYVPFGQAYQSNMNLHLRTAAGSEGQVLAAARREIRAVDAGMPVLATRTLRQHLEASIDFWIAKTAARMFLLFGGVALLMAVIGLYGVRAYAVSRRTREIGIRMAIGASAGDATRMVLREGVRLTALGLGFGLVLALGLGKLLSGMLYEVSGLDPLVFAVSALALAGASLLACYLPARRAARIEPMVALRDE